MLKSFLSVSGALLLLLSIFVSPVEASSLPQAVNFEVSTVIPPDGTSPTYGPFTATGPAVDGGLICPTGQTQDAFVKAQGGQSGKIVTLQVIKQFTCDNGSGEFFVKLEVRLDQKGDNFNWMIIRGTGTYEKLHGTGQGVGLPIPEGVFDIYEGFVISTK